MLTVCTPERVDYSIYSKSASVYIVFQCTTKPHYLNDPVTTKSFTMLTLIPPPWLKAKDISMLDMSAAAVDSYNHTDCTLAAVNTVGW